MKYVFISKHGDILPLAQRIEEESNQVDMYVCPDESLIRDKHVTSSSPDVIVIDSFGFGTFAQRLKSNGFAVIGSSMITDRLESDPMYCDKILKMCGLTTTGSNGIEVLINGWYNGKVFFNHLYSIDSVVSPGNISDKLYSDGINRLKIALAKANYCGPVGLIATVTKDKVWYRELRTRFSLPTLVIMREGLKNRISMVLQTMASGVNRAFMFRTGYFISVQMSLQRDTLFNGTLHCNVSVEAPAEETLKHLWLYNISRKQNGLYEYRGTGGRAAVATARGETIREARRRVYRTISNFGLKDVVYLQRVGVDALGGFACLKQWGYLS